MIEVTVPHTDTQRDQVRTLMRTFVHWHRERHQQDTALIDAYFDQAAFDAELATLPYERLLLATANGEPAGCVAIKRLDDGACEMKRMYVDDRFRGQGVGRALTERIIADARELGYTVMRLDTSIRQAEAQGLYERFGFERIEPYYELSDELRAWLVFMQLRLG